MSYDSDIHHRRSIRLRHYDYAAAGAYFVTICVQERESGSSAESVVIIRFRKRAKCMI